MYLYRRRFLVHYVLFLSYCVCRISPFLILLVPLNSHTGRAKVAPIKLATKAMEPARFLLELIEREGN
jgi:hypothetical protein